MNGLKTTALGNGAPSVLIILILYKNVSYFTGMSFCLEVDFNLLEIVVSFPSSH